jgi:chemotaxis family two-component system response regulator Rcp1
VKRAANVLLVDDNPGDVRLTIEALREISMPTRLHVVGDGVEAMAFLLRQGQYQLAPRPALVLLDLNMPRKNGREVLAEMKGDPQLASIPVVVLTTSREQSDILAAYALHANCCITKPADFDQFLTTVKSIGDFWFTTTCLPTE